MPYKVRHCQAFLIKEGEEETGKLDIMATSFFSSFFFGMHVTLAKYSQTESKGSQA